VLSRRFFNGRGGDIDGALQQFKESTEIRKSIRDIETYENIDVEDYEAMRHLVSKNVRFLRINSQCLG